MRRKAETVIAAVAAVVLVTGLLVLVLSRPHAQAPAQNSFTSCEQRAAELNPSMTPTQVFDACVSQAAPQPDPQP